MSGIWDTAEYWVFGAIFAGLFYKGLDLMFATPSRPCWGSVLMFVGVAGLLLTIPWTRDRISSAALSTYARFGSPHPTISLIFISLLGAVIFGGVWKFLGSSQSATPPVAQVGRRSTDPFLVGSMAVSLQRAKDPKNTRVQMKVTVANRGGMPTIVKQWTFGWDCGKQGVIYMVAPLYPIDEKDESGVGLIDEQPSKKIIIQPGDEAQYTLRYTLPISMDDIRKNGLDLHLTVVDVMGNPSEIEDHTDPGSF